MAVDHDHLVAERDPRAVAQRRDPELIRAAQHAVIRQVEPVAARVEIGDRDLAATALHHEDVGARPAGQRPAGGSGHEDVVARPARQRPAGALPHHDVVARPAGNLARPAQHLPDPAHRHAQMREPGIALRRRKHMERVLRMGRGQPRDPVEPRGVGARDAVEMDEPPVRQQGEQAQPVIAAPGHDEDVIGDRRHGDILQIGEAAAAAVDQVVEEMQRPVGAHSSTLSEPAPRGAEDREARAMRRDRLERGRRRHAKPLRRPEDVQRREGSPAGTEALDPSAVARIRTGPDAPSDEARREAGPGRPGEGCHRSRRLHAKDAAARQREQPAAPASGRKASRSTGAGAGSVAAGARGPSILPSAGEIMGEQPLGPPPSSSTASSPDPITALSRASRAVNDGANTALSCRRSSPAADRR